MNWVDIIFIIVLIITGLVGFWKGLIRIVVAFIALFLSIILAGWISQALANAFNWQAAASGAVWQTLTFIVFLIALFGIFYWVGTRLEKFVKWTPIGWINRLGGLGLGIVIGFTICGFISSLLGMIVQYDYDILGHVPTAGIQASIGKALAESALVPAVNTYFTWFSKMLPGVIDKGNQIYHLFG